MTWARAMRVGGSGRKLVLYVLANWADKHGFVSDHCSQAEISAETELSERQVRRIVNELEPWLERFHRPGNGQGRRSDAFRLRMKEMPAIVGAARQPDKLSTIGNRTFPVGQPDISHGGNRTFETQPDMPEATGQKEISPTPPKEKTTPSKRTPKGVPKGSPVEARRLLAELRPAMSETGNIRSKPKLCDTALPPLLEVHGFDAVLAAARRFYGSLDAQRDRGEFQPGLQVVANDGRLEAMIQNSAAGAVDWAAAVRIHTEHGYWNPANGPAPDQPGYRGPVTLKTQGARP
jgi:hypothetical protein